MLISKVNNVIKCQNADVRYVFNGKNMRMFYECSNR
jgi:hypothetical protein